MEYDVTRSMARAVLFLMVLVGSGSAVQAQQLRIGYVDTDRVLAEAPAFAGIRESMEREFEPFRQELDSLETALRTANEALQTDTLTEAVRAQRMEALQQQIEYYQFRSQQLQQQAVQRENQLMEPVLRRVREQLQVLRREGNYSFIISQQDAILAVDPDLDLTEELIRRLGSD